MAAVTLLSNSLRQIVHSHRASVHQVAKLVAALIRVARVTAGLVDSNGSQVYDSSHLQADCQEPRSAPEPYARQSSMGYLYLCVFIFSIFLLFLVQCGRLSWLSVVNFLIASYINESAHIPTVLSSGASRRRFRFVLCL